MRGVRVFSAILGVGLLFQSVAFGRELTYSEKLSDLDQIVAIMKSGYGPLQYKKAELGIDIDVLRNEYAGKLRGSRSNREFYYLLVEFVAEFRDSHFGASLPTNYGATLPFSTDLIRGKVLIDSINRSKLDEKRFPFVIGDEIVEINGEPVGLVLDQLQKQVGAGNPLTARRKAAMRLTVRQGKWVPVPNGSVIFKIRHGSSEIVESVKLNWEVTGAPIDEMRVPAEARVSPREFLNDFDPNEFKMLSTRDMWAEFEPARVEDSYRCSGSTRIAIPTDATMVIEKPFVAYYHSTPKGNVGYLRIPHYNPQNEKSGAFEYNVRFAQYEYAISVLEKNTVGLVIDQDHNCGGSVDFVHQVIGFFMSKTFQPLQFQLLGTKEQFLLYKNWMESRPPYTAERIYLERVFELVRAAWESGTFMTPKTALDGVPEVRPNAVVYTKPVLILIDEMAGSGGDAFPALMQGFGRAKLLGNATMGAGGHVRELPPLYYSQIGLRLTKSLFFRPDGLAVENRGAEPDFAYVPSRDDFMYGYRNYQAYYVSKLLEML